MPEDDRLAAIRRTLAAIKDCGPIQADWGVIADDLRWLLETVERQRGELLSLDIVAHRNQRRLDGLLRLDQPWSLRDCLALFVRMHDDGLAPYEDEQAAIASAREILHLLAAEEQQG